MEANTEKTYRTRLLEYLCYEQKMLEEERQRLDARLLEIREHMSSLTKDKQKRRALEIERRRR
jgi:hypothetical protein